MKKLLTKLSTNPRWQRRRLAIMKRDEFTCRYCGNETTELHIHHLIDLNGRNPWESEDDHLLTICATCQTDEENLKSDDHMLIGMFSLSGLKRRDLYSLATELRRYLNARNKKEKFLDLMEYLAHV
jgi:hypothetical protein